VLVPGSSGADARRMVKSLRARLRDAMRAGGWPITFSIGAVTSAGAPDGIEPLLHRADELMYEVKQAGRDAVRFEELDRSVPPLAA
jgi:GGDEF domain-containing protein